MATDFFPFTKYREAVLMETRLRKATKCIVCWEPMAVGEKAWRTLIERIDNGVLRSQRFHLAHFAQRGHHEDWSLADGTRPRALKEILAKRAATPTDSA